VRRRRKDAFRQDLRALALLPPRPLRRAWRGADPTAGDFLPGRFFLPTPTQSRPAHDRGADALCTGPHGVRCARRANALLLRLAAFLVLPGLVVLLALLVRFACGRPRCLTARLRLWRGLGLRRSRYRRRSRRAWLDLPCSRTGLGLGPLLGLPCGRSGLGLGPLLGLPCGRSGLGPGPLLGLLCGRSGLGPGPLLGLHRGRRRRSGARCRGRRGLLGSLRRRS
jgi:hypothetical protein